MTQYQEFLVDLAWFTLALLALVIWLVRTHAGRRAFQHAPVRPHRLAIPDLLALLVLYLTVQTLCQHFFPIDPQASWTRWNQSMVALILSQFILAAAVLVMACRRFPTRWAGFGLLPPKPLGTVPLALLYFFVAAGLTLLTLNITVWISQALGYDQIQKHILLERLGDHPPALSIVLMAVSAVIGAALSEELLFRGIVQNTLIALLARRYPVTPAPLLTQPVDPAAPTDPAAPAPHGTTPTTAAPLAPSALARWAGIIITALIFALFHADWQHLPALVVLALCLGYAYERHGNLLLSLLIHALFNAVTITMTLLQSVSPAP